MGCYPSGKHLQGLFTTGYMSQGLDECRDNCSIDGRSYAAISESTCFCSDGLPTIQQSEDTQCNLPCTGNINQTCGSRTHYSGTWLIVISVIICFIIIIKINVRPLKDIYMFSVPTRFLFGGRLLFFFVEFLN